MIQMMIAMDHFDIRKGKVLGLKAHKADMRACPMGKPKALDLEAQKPEWRACPMGKPQALSLKNWMVAS
jgi:hypothetical protein